MASRSPISKLVNTEDHEHAQRELQQLVDAVPQHIVVLSKDGHRIYANQAARDYHSLTLDQFLVEPITNCFHLDDIENYNRIRDSGIASGEPWEAEARLRRKDGAYRWFLIRAKPLRNEHGLVQALTVRRVSASRGKKEDRRVQRTQRLLREALVSRFRNSYATAASIQAGSHHQRAVGGSVVVQHGSDQNPRVPSSRLQG